MYGLTVILFGCVIVLWKITTAPLNKWWSIVQKYYSMHYENWKSRISKDRFVVWYEYL